MKHLREFVQGFRCSTADTELQAAKSQETSRRSFAWLQKMLCASACSQNCAVCLPTFLRRLLCLNTVLLITCRPFERTSKRRKSYSSETRVKRGERYVHGEVELVERLGRNDLCPCGSGRRFQAVLHQIKTL
ncbi:MAG: SEC-C metal-binding domain-containing protein [Hyphomicrobiales bacterium]